MFNDAQLKSIEAEHHAHEDAENEWIVRNTRRYLALRKEGVISDLVCHGNTASFTRTKGDDLDAAADRLLEGGE